MSCDSERIDNIFNYFSRQESLSKSVSLGLYAKLDALATVWDIASENISTCALRMYRERCMFISWDSFPVL